MAPKSRCPRCGGNQFRTKDQFGDYLSCLQCGRTTELDGPAGLRVSVSPHPDGLRSSERPAAGQDSGRR